MSDLTQDEKIYLYNAGKYSVPVPPVTVYLWSVEDWINYIDIMGIWHTSKLAPVPNQT
jgi:hypothetical protein